MSESLPTGWKLEPLGRIAQVVSGGTPSRYLPELWEGGSIPWVTPTDITGTSGRFLSESREHITELGLQSCSAKKLPPGTLLMTSRATLGEVKIALGEVCTNQGFKSLIPFKGVDGRFLYYQIGLNKERYKGFGIGSTFLEVNKRDTERFELLVAPEKEQHRIAEILSTVDEAIEQTEVLITKYQQVKAGLMQDLFTRGVTLDGQLRPTYKQAPHLYRESPLGWIPKDWEVRSVSQLGRLGRGRVISQDYLEAHPGEYPVYSSQSLNEGIFGLIDTYDFEGEYVTWTTDGAFAGTVFFRSGRFNCTNVCGTIRPFESVSARFLAGALSGRTARHVSYVGNPKLMNNVMAKIEVPIPKDLAEQKMIVQKIEAAVLVLKSHGEDLRKLRQQKQGLMQDLLTGRVRVKVAESAMVEAFA